MKRVIMRFLTIDTVEKKLAQRMIRCLSRAEVTEAGEEGSTKAHFYGRFFLKRDRGNIKI